MPQIRCQAGHYFDPDRNTSCPHCGVQISEVPATRMADSSSQPAPPIAATHVPNAPVPQPSVPSATPTPTRAYGSPEAGKTRMVFKGERLQPVVGWIVCVDGTDRGRSFTLQPGRRSLGRGEAMDVGLNDDAITRESPSGYLIYDERSNRFTLAPGESAQLVYLNDEAVHVPAQLSAYDRIELGQSKLVFVPLCCEKFQW